MMPKKLLTTNWQKHIMSFVVEYKNYIILPNKEEYCLRSELYKRDAYGNG